MFSAATLSTLAFGVLHLVSPFFSVVLPGAEAAVVRGITWSTSSVAPVTDGITAAATNLSDNKQATPWIEGESGSGLGSFAKADFGAEKTINELRIWGGCWYNRAYWGHFSRPKTIIAEFSDGTTQELTLKDEFAPQVFPLAAPKKTTSVKLKVTAVYQGDAYNDTAISEIVFIDNAAETVQLPSAAKASTTLPPDGDGYYDAKNAVDGMVDSLWCEGGKGDGTGDWIEITFPAAVTVSKLKIRNGVTYSSEVFKKANRATAATLTFSDGTTQTVALRGLLPMEESVSFTSVTTSSVKITFTTIIKGTEFNDMCVAEVNVVP